MPESPHDDLPELESAIHHLKEAQTLHNSEEFHIERENGAIGKVNDALDEMGEYINTELGRLEENSPVPLEELE